MAVVTVAERIEAPARLTGGDIFKRIDYFGDSARIGDSERIHLPEGLPVLERLEVVDDADLTYRYQVIESGEMPVTDYRGYVRVTPCGPGACSLKIECTYTAVGVSDQAWANIWTAKKTGLIAQIRASIAGA